MPKPTVDFIPSPNFKARRRPVWAPKDAPTPFINAVVIHYTGSMNLDGTIEWFKSKVSAVSAHYVIGREGRLVQMVEDAQSAWHAGRSAMYPLETPPREPGVNDFSIGIELVGVADGGFTDKQLATLYEVLARLVSKYHIPAERVVGHCHIAPGRKIDPDGFDHQFPWAKTREVCQLAYASRPVSSVASL